MVQLLVPGACGRGVHIAADQSKRVERGKGVGEGRREKRVGREEVEKGEKEKELEGRWKEEREGEWRNQGLGYTLQTLALASYFPPLESSRTSPKQHHQLATGIPHATLDPVGNSVHSDHKQHLCRPLEQAKITLTDKTQ